MTAEALQALKRAHEVEDALLQVMLQGSGINAMADALAERIGNSVAVADQLMHLVSTSPRGEHGDRLRREAIRRGGTGREVLDDPTLGPLYRQVAEGRRARLWPAYPGQGMDLRRLMAPILAGRDVLGFVTVIEDSRALQKDDAVVLEHAALILALEFLQQRAVLEVEMRLRADFLRDLFAENYASRDAIGLRASLLGIALFRSWDLLVIEPDETATVLADTGSHDLTAAWTRLLDVVRRTARAISSGSVIVAQGEGVVVLRPAANGDAGRGNADHLADAIRDHVRRLFRTTGGTVSVGIGGRCDGIADFGQRYAEARRALRVSRSLGLKDRTQSLESLGVYAILYQQGNEQALLTFALRVLEPLLEYDRRRRTALVQTLDAYLVERGGLRRTAARLHLHPNTLRGRITRIKETAQLDLDDAKVLLNLQLALEIYRLHVDATGSGAPPSIGSSRVASVRRLDPQAAIEGAVRRTARPRTSGQA